MMMSQPTSDRRQSSPALGPAELAELREKLMAERDRIEADYKHEIAEAQSLQEDGVEDFEELAAKETDRDQLYTYSEEDRETLRLIEEALQRMDDGTYGFCLETGEPIPLERLRAIPWARYRADVQERIERAERSRGH
jgi:DnaK suppressor protein